MNTTASPVLDRLRWEILGEPIYYLMVSDGKISWIWDARAARVVPKLAEWIEEAEGEVPFNHGVWLEATWEFKLATGATKPSELTKELFAIEGFRHYEVMRECFEHSLYNMRKTSSPFYLIRELSQIQNPERVTLKVTIRYTQDTPDETP